MTEPRAAGPILDALGATFDLDEHDHVTDVLLVGKVLDAETGETGVVIGRTSSQDWVTQFGLLGVARRLLDSSDIEEAD